MLTPNTTSVSSVWEGVLLDADGSAVFIQENPDHHMTQLIGGACGCTACGIIEVNVNVGRIRNVLPRGVWLTRSSMVRRRTINEIADMICGNVEHFQYRSSACLTEFFEHCDMEQFVHDGSTRKKWVG